MAYNTLITNYPKLQVTAAYPNYPDGSYHGGYDTKTPNNADTNTFAIITGRCIISEYGQTPGRAPYGNYIMVYDSTYYWGDEAEGAPPSGMTWLSSHYKSRNAKVGDWVTPASFMGVYGQTGNATGPHVHSEILKGYGFNTGIRRNPAPFIGTPNAIGLYDVVHGTPFPPTPPHRGDNYMPLMFYHKRRY